jgi:hypothetical protein
MPGPFHRLESPTQTKQDALLQVNSGEIWGKAARGSNIPTVKAYRRAIPAGERGVEFTTDIMPEPGSGSPYEARWYFPFTPGVIQRTANGVDYAVISAVVSNYQT